MSQLNAKAAAVPHVFISYSSSDVDLVLSIAQELEKAGISIWRDGDRILGGHYYGEQIVHALAHSKVMLIMCSPQALGSDNVHREIMLNWDYYNRTYLPVWLSPRIEIPERFCWCLVGCQSIEIFGQAPAQWLPRVLAALESLGVGPSASTVSNDASTTNPARRRAGGPRFAPGDRPVLGADWELDRLLGKGDYGEVWLARNPHLPGQAPVALKFCFNLDAESKELLRHEADMVLRAQRSVDLSGMVPLLHTYLNNEPPCLEYPYVEGGTLVTLIDDARQAGVPLTPVQVQSVVERIARIVGSVHRATPQLVHRDLKPSNVLVSRHEDKGLAIRVIDFGIGGVVARPALERSRSAHSLQENVSAILTGAYTPLYASPQQIQGAKPDPRDDVYSLGVIWHQLLIGDLTAPAPTGRRWVQSLKQRGMTEAAVELLMDCLEARPEHRPDHGMVLADRLRGLRAAEVADVSPPRPVVTATEPKGLSESATSSPGTGVLAPSTMASTILEPHARDAADNVGAASPPEPDSIGRPSDPPGAGRSPPAETAANVEKPAGSAPRGASSRRQLYVAITVHMLVAFGISAALFVTPGPADATERMPVLMLFSCVAGAVTTFVAIRAQSLWGQAFGTSILLSVVSGGLLTISGSSTGYDWAIPANVSSFAYPFALLPYLAWFVWHERRRRAITCHADFQSLSQLPRLALLGAVQLALVLCWLALEWHFYSDNHAYPKSVPTHEIIVWIVIDLVGFRLAWTAWHAARQFVADDAPISTDLALARIYRNAAVRRLAILGLSAPIVSLLLPLLHQANDSFGFVMFVGFAYYWLILPAFMHLIIAGLRASRLQRKSAGH